MFQSNRGNCVSIRMATVDLVRVLSQWRAGETLVRARGKEPSHAHRSRSRSRYSRSQFSAALPSFSLPRRRRQHRAHGHVVPKRFQSGFEANTPARDPSLTFSLLPTRRAPPHVDSIQACPSLHSTTILFCVPREVGDSLIKMMRSIEQEIRRRGNRTRPGVGYAAGGQVPSW